MILFFNDHNALENRLERKNSHKLYKFITNFEYIEDEMKLEKLVHVTRV